MLIQNRDRPGGVSPRKPRLQIRSNSAARPKVVSFHPLSLGSKSTSLQHDVQGKWRFGVPLLLYFEAPFHAKLLSIIGTVMYSSHLGYAIAHSNALFDQLRLT